MNCPLCKHTENIVQLEVFNGYTILKCTYCELEFSSPMKAANSSHYEALEWYGKRWEFGETLKFFKGKEKDILEIGCGRGYFLREAILAGNKVTGIDFNASAIKFAKEHFGIDNTFKLSDQEFSKFFSNKKFELICFFHTIEHLEDPLKFLSNVRNILVDKGFIAFSVPNKNRFSIKLLKREIWDYPPHHLTRWDENSVNKLLLKSGFKIIFSKYEPVKFLKVTESVGNFLISLINLKFRANDTKKSYKYKHFIYFPKKLFKATGMFLLSPFGLIIMLIAKMKRLNGLAYLVIAQKTKS